MPRIALRYRLQTDIHGLDRSRHRIARATTGARLVLELDVHGAPAPQVIGAVMAAAAMRPPSARRIGVPRRRGRARPARRAPRGRSRSGACSQGIPGVPPAARPRRPGRRRVVGRRRPAWRGVPAERRWAMEVLGLRAGHRPSSATTCSAGSAASSASPTPTTGGAARGAAERIAELTEARELLLDVARLGGRATAVVAAAERPAHDELRQRPIRAWPRLPFTSPSPARPARSATRSSTASRRGQLLGPDQPVVLRLLEIEPAMKALEGVVMELDDGAHPLLDGHRGRPSDLKTAFDGTSWALLVGSIPRKAGMERGDLLKVNGGIFKPQGAGHQRARRERRARARRRQPVQHQLPHRAVATRPTCPPTAGSR